MTYLGSRNQAASVAKTTEDTASIGVSASTPVAANDSRLELFLFNDHASQKIYLSLGGTAQTGKGIVLLAQTGLVLDTYTGAVSAIASGASTTLCICEI